jgi:hypothetical protein
MRRTMLVPCTTRATVWCGALAATLGALAASPAAAQSTVIKVTGDDRQPIPFAWVVVRGGSSGIANERGELSLGAERHVTLTLDVRRIGYQPWSGKITLPDSASTQTVTLSRVAQPLAGVTVSGSASKSGLETEGFYDRWLQKQKGAYRNATFIGPEMIEARNAPLTTDLLDRVIGIRFHRDSRGALAVIGSGMRPPGTTFQGGNDPGNSLDGAACFMNILIDGGPVCPPIGCHYVFPGDPPGASVDDHTIDINKAVSPKQVAGIEVYPSRDGMPPSIQELFNGCGIVLIWTIAGK